MNKENFNPIKNISKEKHNDRFIPSKRQKSLFNLMTLD